MRKVEEDGKSSGEKERRGRRRDGNCLSGPGGCGNGGESGTKGVVNWGNEINTLPYYLL